MLKEKEVTVRHNTGSHVGAWRGVKHQICVCEREKERECPDGGTVSFSYSCKSHVLC